MPRSLPLLPLVALSACSLQSSQPQDTPTRYAHPGCAAGTPVSFRLFPAPEGAPLPENLTANASEITMASETVNVRFDFCADFESDKNKLVQALQLTPGVEGDPNVAFVRVRDGVVAEKVDEALFGDVEPGFLLWSPFLPGFNQGAALLGNPETEVVYFAERATLRDGKYRALRWIAGRLAPGDLLFGETRCLQDETFSTDIWQSGTASITASVCQNLLRGEGSWRTRALEVVVQDDNPGLPAEARGRRVVSGAAAEAVYENVGRHHGCNPYKRLKLPEVTYLWAEATLTGETYEAFRYGDAEPERIVKPGEAHPGMACEGFEMPELDGE